MSSRSSRSSNERGVVQKTKTKTNTGAQPLLDRALAAALEKNGGSSVSLVADLRGSLVNYQGRVNNPHHAPVSEGRAGFMLVRTMPKTTLQFKSPEAKQALIGVFTNITNFLEQEKYKEAICEHFGIKPKFCQPQLDLIKKSIENITNNFSQSDGCDLAKLTNIYKEIIYLLAPNLQEAEDRNTVYQIIERLFLNEYWYPALIPLINSDDFLKLSNKYGEIPPQEIQSLRKLIQYLNKAINEAVGYITWIKALEGLKSTGAFEVDKNGVTLISITPPDDAAPAFSTLSLNSLTQTRR